MKNVKSSYIKTQILSYICQKKQLKIFKYNKYIQNLIHINLFDYRLNSRTFIIYLKNGKAREFTSEHYNLLYEGEYRNGKKNGMGREYHNNYKTLYEGEYLNGERNGKGKEFNDKGKLIFEGDYINGKRWNGNGYDINNNIIYTLKNGNGIIKEYNSNGTLKFEGEYLNGEKNGSGKEYNGDGELKFEGEYSNGKRNGFGIEYGFYGNVQFKGEFLNDSKWNGNGYDIDRGNVYKIKNGKGMIREYYVGVYRDLRLEGEYLNGQLNGKVKQYYYKGRLFFEGEYINGEKNGKGKEYGYSGEIKFEGEYLYNAKRKGKEYNNKGKLEYEGEYLFGNKWIGKLYDENGKVICEYINGDKKIIS